MSKAMVFSASAHGLLIACLLSLFHGDTMRALIDGPETVAATHLVWLSLPGDGGGGGGGGRRMSAPASRLERRAEAPSPRPSAPVARPASTAADDIRPAEPTVLAPLAPVASDLATLPGVIEALPSAPSSGPGTLGGDGTGKGPGLGPGSGPGLGPGSLGGAGTGPYRSGSGVTAPIPTRRATPRYTAAAMRARLQGVVLVECIVETDGECANVRVLRGLEPSLGLNDEAIRTAREWRFRPGQRLGSPVPVLVTFEVTFLIH
jgi:protein TonB